MKIYKISEIITKQEIQLRKKFNSLQKKYPKKGRPLLIFGIYLKQFNNSNSEANKLLIKYIFKI